MEKKYYCVKIRYTKPYDRKTKEPEHVTGGWTYTEASSEEEAIGNLERWAERTYKRGFRAYSAELVTDFVPKKEFLING